MVNFSDLSVTWLRPRNFRKTLRRSADLRIKFECC